MIAFILAIVIRQYVAEAYKIPTGSMQPTLMGDNDADENYGDRIVVDKLYYLLHPVRRWDVIVFKFPYPAATSIWPYCEDRELYEFGPDKTLEACNKCHEDRGLRIDVERSHHVVWSRRNYVKRCLALSGETIEIRHGDIYISNDDLNCQIPVKPEKTQDELWFRSYFCDFDKADPFEKIRDGLEWDVPSEGWSAQGAGLRVEPPGGESVRFSWKKVTDIIVVDGNRELPGQGDAGGMLVGDIKVDTCFTFHSPESELRIEIVEDDCTYALVLTPDSRQCRLQWVINKGTQDEQSEGRDIRVSLPVDVEHRIAFSSVDDTLLVKLEEPGYTWRSKFDKERIKLLYTDDPFLDSRGGYDVFGVKASASLEVRGGPVSMGKLDIYRDIYYTDSPRSGQGNATVRPYEIPDGCYFAMGDNSANSSDSRSWGTFPHKNIVGRAGFVFYPFGPIINWKKMRIIWTNRLKIIR